MQPHRNDRKFFTDKDLNKENMKKYKVVSVTSELGAGTRGASLGLEGMKAVARTGHDTTFDDVEIVAIKNRNDLLDVPPVHPNAKYCEGILEVGAEVCDSVAESIKHSNGSVIVSGDHSMAFASISGLKKSFPGKTIGIVWVDAHADLHTPYTSPTGNMHGMPLAMAASEDNKDSQINQPLDESVAIWEKLKNVGYEGPKYHYDHLIYVGVRSAEKPERSLMDTKGIVNVTVDEFREIGLDETFQKIKERLADCDLVYVSFDVDSMDPSVSKGTGTPVPGGLSFEEALDLNVKLANWEKVKVWEIVEINPLLDTENKMAACGFEIFGRVLPIFQNK